MSKQKVFVQLPRTGLGNKMLVWARGFAFAREHNLELFVSRWWSISPGVWLRGENKKRLYLGYFKRPGFWSTVGFTLFKRTATKIYEPVNKSTATGDILYVFGKLQTEGDYFEKMKPHRAAIKAGLYNMLHPDLQTELAAYPSPEIAVHIRRGDFKKGSTITELDFFIESIQSIRKLAGKDLAVTVFTDANEAELASLHMLPNISLSPAKADILDILLLGKSQVCILSISSTFSFWGAFLSDGIVIRHASEWHPVIRPAEVNNLHYEGVLNVSNPDPILIDQVSKL